MRSINCDSSPMRSTCRIAFKIDNTRPCVTGLKRRVRRLNASTPLLSVMLWTIRKAASLVSMTSAK